MRLREVGLQVELSDMKMAYSRLLAEKEKEKDQKDSLRRQVSELAQELDRVRRSKEEEVRLSFTANPLSSSYLPSRPTPPSVRSHRSAPL